MVSNTCTRKKCRSGFSLMELLVLVLIMSIIFALAVPSLIRSRMAGHESSAIASLKAILIAEQQYRIVTGTSRYTNLQDLNTSLPNYIDPVLATGSKSGYCFAIVTYKGSSFTAIANPISFGKTGRRYFFIDMSGVVRFNRDQMAGSLDAPVE